MAASCPQQTLEALAITQLQLTQPQLASCAAALREDPGSPVTAAPSVAATLRARIRGWIHSGWARAEWERCQELDVEVVPWFCPRYPVSLFDLIGPPSVLYLRGAGPWPPPPTVTIVGARKATPGARHFAEDIGEAAIGCGVALVSGLAYGIDQAAHRGAQQAGGPSYAVMAGGVDRVDPAGARPLADRILAHGLLISESPLGMVPTKPFYPRRNRILAALSPATLVVEAAERSGSLITAHHALDLGRDIYAVPGALTNPQAAGTNRLIRDGAMVVLEVADLAAVLPGVDATERDPWSEALRTPQSVESLAAVVGRPLEEVSTRLVEMEIEGVVQNLGGGMFQRREL
jgi:DNA processing protein